MKKLELSVVFRKILPIKIFHNGSEIIILKKDSNKKEDIKKVQFLCPSCKSFLIENEKKLICKTENCYFDIISTIPKLTISDKKKYEKR